MKIELIKKLPKHFAEIIRLVGGIADREGISAYIVGGPVRDILLDRKNHDLDFVVEGNAIEFAEALNKTLKGRLKTHRAFYTATIEFKKQRIDLATARSEVYKKIAAYPDVTPGFIKDDLFRRDFTVNAMAVSINRKSFGELIDFYNGLNDLKKGVVKVLHDKSFMDDPTRIFRAVRFAVRLKFRIDSRTKKLMKESILAGCLGEVNRGRIKKEVESFLKEKDPLKCLEEFSKLI